MDRPLFDLADHAGVQLLQTRDGWVLHVWTTAYHPHGRQQLKSEHYDRLTIAEALDILDPVLRSQLGIGSD